MKRFAILPVLCAAALGAATPAPAVAESYLFFGSDLSNNMNITGINAGNDVVGSYDVSGTNYRGFVYQSSTATLTPIDYPSTPDCPTVSTYANAINDSGTIVGWYQTTCGYGNFIRTADGAVSNYVAPYAATLVGINNHGDFLVLGNSGTSPSFIAKASGAVIPIFDPKNPSVLAQVNHISDSDTVSGVEFIPIPTPFAFAAGTFTSYPIGLRAATNPGIFSFVQMSTGINDSGTAIGWGWDDYCLILNYCYTLSWESYVRDAAGKLIPFDVQHHETSAMAINNGGAVTGYFDSLSKAPPLSSTMTAYPGYQGFIRSRTGKITTFLPPGYLSALPTVINDSGAVAGIASDASNYLTGFVRLP